ncbi:DUF6537 domain-containing protein [Cupriavidus sp. CP313]
MSAPSLLLSQDSHGELVVRYRATIEEVLATLDADNRSAAIEIANLPDGIRGFGHVKARHLETVLPRLEALMIQWRTTAGAGAARSVS